MPAERTAMRHVREVLRLRTAGISGNEISPAAESGAVDRPTDTAAAGGG